MYKVIKTLVVAVIGTTSMTAIASKNCSNYTGPYLGGNIGYGYGSGKLTTQFSINGKTLANNFGVRGVRGGLHGGYGKQFSNKTYLGIEAAADYSNSFVKAVPDLNTYQSKRREAYGLALRMGGVLGASMLTYLKAGMESAKWKTTGKYSVQNGQFTAVRQSKQVTGAVFGVGMETLVTKNIMVGGECAYTIYGKATNKTTLDTVDNKSTRTDKFKPRTADFRLRASYKW